MHCNRIFFRRPARIPLATVALALLPYGVAAWGQATGDWETTALTRIDIVAIQAPGLIPRHTVDITDGNYRFAVDGSFSAGDIQGVWTQKGAKYLVAPNRVALQNQFRLNIENTPPAEGEEPVTVNDVRLLDVKFTGVQLDNGIWGDELYTYKLDVNQGERRQILRLSMTVHVAGFPAASAASARSGRVAAVPGGTALEIAAAAVMRALSGM